MPDRPHNAPADFDLTGDNANAATSALSVDTPVQGDAPTPRLREQPPPAEHARRRTPHEVIGAHLEQSRTGNVEDDLAENYHTDVVILTRWGVHHGHDGIRKLADKLKEELPDVAFSYDEVVVEGGVGFLEWQAQASDGSHVCDGADSYIVRDGRIAAQTIHYIVRADHGRPEEWSQGGSASTTEVQDEERWVAHRQEGWTVESPDRRDPVSVHDDFDEARAALHEDSEVDGQPQ